MKQAINMEKQYAEAKTQSQQLELLRYASLLHPFYLGKYVLGYDKFEQIHYDMLSFILYNIDSKEEECLDLEPRGCFKTTAVSITLPIWFELKDPEDTIMINHKVHGMSKAILEEIRGQYTINHLFIELFGNRIGDINRSGFITSRFRKKASKEATIAAGSVDKEVVGSHPKKTVNDDIVTLKDYLSEKERKKSDTFYEAGKYLTEQITIDVGTRWHEDDLYRKIISALPERCKRIKAIVDENGKPYFESKYPLKKIDKLRKGGEYLEDENGANVRVASMLFDAVMMQKPGSDKAGKPFANIKFIKDEDIGEVYMRSVAYYDPAFSQNNTSCFNAIPCIATDNENKKIVKDFLYKQMMPDELIDNLLPGFIIDNEIGILVYEANSAQILLGKMLRDMIKKNNISCEVIEIKSVSNKHLRIMGAQPTIISEVKFRESRMKDTFGDYAQAVIEIKNYTKESEFKDATDSIAGCISYSNTGEAGAL